MLLRRYPFLSLFQELLEGLSNVYDVAVSVVGKSGGNTSVDGYINATLWTVVFNDPVGDVPGFEVRVNGCPLTYEQETEENNVVVYCI